MPINLRQQRGAVDRLVAAGVILIGKTNLDQFATGLVGMRTPYPAPRNALDAKLVPGGLSSGSAVVVADGLVTFALGTDTAGSGRVPAALNNVVGLKPSLRFRFEPRRGASVSDARDDLRRYGNGCRLRRGFSRYGRLRLGQYLATAAGDTSKDLAELFDPAK